MSFEVSLRRQAHNEYWRAGLFLPSLPHCQIEGRRQRMGALLV